MNSQNRTYGTYYDHHPHPNAEPQAEPVELLAELAEFRKKYEEAKDLLRKSKEFVYRNGVDENASGVYNDIESFLDEEPAKEVWSQEKCDPSDPYGDIIILRNGVKTATLWLDDAPEHEFNAQQRANAAYIVKCCNDNSNLVDALLEACECIADLGSGKGGWAWEEVIRGIKSCLESDK